MADSRLETSLHPVHDLALLPRACVAIKRLRTNERQTRVISQKQLARWASHASFKFTSIRGVTVILSHVSRAALIG